jgi:uncharacterized RDD family membrane protein YckC
MKCPKCGYIGFEEAERCRNCGYDFSLSAPAGPGELPLRRDDPIGPLGDFDLGDSGPPATDTPPGRPRRRHDPAFDPGVTPAAGSLPLFGGDPAEDLPLVQTAAPTPPLAVRRAPSPLSRPRPRPTPRSEPQPALTFGAAEGAGDLAIFPAEADAPGAQGGAADVATLGARAAAGLLDAVLLAALDLVVVYFTLRICRIPAADAWQLPLVPLGAFLALLDGGYLALFTLAGGQTIGQMAAGVRVVGESLSRVSSGQAAGRTVALGASLLPAGLGLVSVLLDRGRRGLHDRLSGTRVVRAGS